MKKNEKIVKEFEEGVKIVETIPATKCDGSITIIYMNKWNDATCSIAKEFIKKMPAEYIPSCFVKWDYHCENAMDVFPVL